ncbi:helix-turn-helix transcriptional regulator [Sphaerobacter sp.]|uniref:helix-turn-helix domain-containing protein n=1 Tax=Sphaerobacter sp. TaxID=2099654 RepID=UPI001D4ECD7D|nr:helix-turn-helix transcriptional regulator [Sphaerobacter sp.]MBX5445252.1 helix-turn-helix transcriptional regulator [Sphaerobacter sp.]
MNTAEQSGAVLRRSRQQIGPALRALRERRGWTLAQLAAESGVSRSQVWRLEQGQSVPSYLTLARLAKALEVEINYFTAFESTAAELDRDLSSYLRRVGIPEDTWAEFGRLGLEARGALLDALRRLIAPQEQVISRHRAAETALAARGLPEAAPLVLSIIDEAGLTPLEFARAWTQFEELPGDRICVAHRLSTVVHAPGLDRFKILRLLYGVEFSDPRLLRWWTSAAQSALFATLQEHESRTIYPLASIERYLTTGEWGMRFAFSRKIVRAHVQATIDLLQQNPRFRIGLVDEMPPLGFFVKGTDGALVYPLTDADPQEAGSNRVALRFSSAEVVTRLRDYFESLWDTIPPERKDSEAVIAWLKSRLG